MLSVVIPTLDAAATLGPCLAALGAAADEIVVVDGGSSDGTPAIAERGGARLVRSAPGRGVQLAAGAEAAKGRLAALPPRRHRAGARLARGCGPAHRRQPDRAACFRFRLDAGERRARLVEAGVALRVRLLGLPYGDQGLLLSRSLYEAAGGYRPLPLMEDVDLVRRIGRVKALEVEATTSAGRWRRDGWLRRSGRNLLCLALWRSGMSAERVARLYG